MKLREQIAENYSLLKNISNTDRLQKQFTVPEYKVLNTFFSIFVSQSQHFVNQDTNGIASLKYFPALFCKELHNLQSQGHGVNWSTQAGCSWDCAEICSNIFHIPCTRQLPSSVRKSWETAYQKIAHSPFNPHTFIRRLLFGGNLLRMPL